MFKKFTSQLQSLPAVGLGDLDKVSLTNRIDYKFALTKENLDKIAPCLLEHYFILEIDGIRIFSYENNYFDTPDLQFFKDHHNGYSNRMKVRIRKYVDSDLCFFEIKKKEKVDRTNKLREVIPDMIATLDEERKNIIQVYTRRSVDDLQLILKNNFKRITLVNKDFTERVTIDTNLHFIDNNQDVKFGKLAIVEIKQSKSNQVSPLTASLKKNKIREQSISKYIYGVIILKPTVKKNNFKPLLKKINKLRK